MLEEGLVTYQAKWSLDMLFVHINTDGIEVHKQFFYPEGRFQYIPYVQNIFFYITK